MSDSPSPGAGVEVVADAAKAAGKSLGQKVEVFARNQVKRFKGMPRGAQAGLAAGGVAMLLPYLGGLASGVKNDLNAGSTFGDGVTGEEETLIFQRRLQQAERARMQREARIQRLTAENMMRIQQYAPHLAAKLLAGRDLPNGAVVIGGQKRMDLFEGVAREMAEGKYGGTGERELAARHDQQAMMQAQAPMGPQE